jgi:hypothetical protein
LKVASREPFRGFGLSITAKSFGLSVDLYRAHT